MGGGGGGGWSTLGDIRALEEKARAELNRTEGKRNVFISFSMDDQREVNLLRAHAKNENSDIEFNDHSVREPYNSERAAYIKERITERIQRSSATVVHLTDAALKSDWVKWEVQKSLELGKKVVAAHPEGAGVSKLPDWLKGATVTTWTNLPKALK
ncbi:TIR domain-containing protein [Sphingopyxis terrae]|uniref:MTH538 TIR-like domain n=1 Tax=Sphingopyxis terrae subsp. ummariensis TaxID=429001 RepID=A0A1Y6FUU0_9SPHN|nr:TIR domain-containing protein [Sphingopyxis terrae]PCF91064.1 molecular chaperone Tir [Sphingopyxis terrae subsp. ummariensis]SMQ76303.1 MTH538 TIR-like domain [Sphingopyxis terrae subsp. ummariensis]